MTALLTIGEFSHLTHLSVKALRHYDEVGLLQPVHVNPSTSYRQYATAQVPTAHLIRRFRDLQMPLEVIREVLEAPDLATRDQAIAKHLERMEEALQFTQATVSSLRALLEGRSSTISVEYRSVPTERAVAVRADVAWRDTERWLGAATNELHRILNGSSGARAGPDSALYSSEFFEEHRGELVAFVPIATDVAVAGPVELIDIPSAHVAITVHHGPFTDLDQAYGALGTFVAERVLATEGPIRERYLATGEEADEVALTTEVCWPIRHIPREET
jgi:DNA-binding transcriptional MerR regulator